MKTSIESAVWIVFGLGVCLYAYLMGLGTFKEPGVGFVAFAAGLFLMVIGVLLRASPPEEGQDGWKQQKHEGTETVPFLRTKTFKLIYTVALLVAYAVLLNPLGYLITTFLVMFGLFLDPGRRRFAVPVGAAFLSTAITYAVFETWLQSQLPRGVFPWW